jgi:hypothetical protein
LGESSADFIEGEKVPDLSGSVPGFVCSNPHWFSRVPYAPR